MRRVLTVFAFSCLFASAANADHIGIYNDVQGSCNGMSALVAPPGQNPVYVVHKFNAGATVAQFKIQDQSGLFLLNLISAYAVLGLWDDGVSSVFGSCVIGDHVLATLNFLWLGTPIVPGCGQTLQVLGALTTAIPGEIVVADCAFNPEIATGGTFYFESAPQACSECPTLPAQSKSWGAVKALYR